MSKINSPNSFDEALSEWEPASMLLRLFISGFSPQSQATIDVLRQICEERLDGNYQLEIIDIFQQPDLARQQQIIATPTLVKYQPQPKKILIGDLSRTDRVLAGLGLASD